ncbi:MAG: PAS domain-containing sensor histidine kinase [Deltaproteobacteria bacterium]|jgi:PAS domain S-box-containing protein|nr:PAS domain-containing sensor histidine kinase [Deltaproteobacteria bacterium]
MAVGAVNILNALSKETLLRTMPSGLFLVDMNRCIVYWNKEAERITGYFAKEVVGQHCSILEGIECNLGCGLFDTGTPDKPIIGTECRIRSKSGEEIVISKNVDFLFLNGQVVGGIESFINISPQKNLEASLRRHGEELESIVEIRTDALEQERERLRNVLDSMTDMAYIVTEDFKLVFANRAMTDVFGPSEGKRCFEVIYASNKPCSSCPWDQIREGTVVTQERSIGPDCRDYELIHSPVYSARGDLQKLVVSRDITDRKEVMAKLIELNNHLDSFVYTVAHDLRSPLTPIMGYAEYLKQEYKHQIDEHGQGLLQEILNQGERILCLMEDLLVLSRVGQLPPPSKPVETNAIVKRVVEDNQYEIQSKHVNIVCEQPLPSLLIPGTLVYELFNNLIMNAVRHGCRTGGQVDVMGEQTRRVVVLSVVDSGPGIPAGERDKVFNVFYRGDNSDYPTGTGVGLATVYKIVRLYHGDVKIEDTPGGGCTVRMQFPVSNVADQA